ncbi:MAG: hypothetical protein NTX82_05135 [Candidatus Parcubacteria bacterium]|nr:hypothetical protein [Candidatus Parcubacteria bacterium]
MNRLTEKERDDLLTLAELFNLKVLKGPHQPWDTENQISYLRMTVEGENEQPVEIYPYCNRTFFTDGNIPGVPLIQVEADIFQVDI